MIGRWVDKNERLPSHNDSLIVSGWFYVRRLTEHGWYVSIRYFDDSDCSWWYPTNTSDGFTPNNSFDEWHQIDGHYKENYGNLQQGEASKA